MFGLEKELKDKDIVHVCEITNAYSHQAIKAKQKYGFKVVTTVWENIPLIDGRTMFEFFENRKMRKDICEQTDTFIAVTERSKETLMIEGVNEERISVIPSGVDQTRFKKRDKNQALIKSFGLEEDDFIVLFVGRLTWQKGVYDLIYAAKKLADDEELKKLRIKIVLCGSGPERKTIQNRIERLGLSNIKLVGGVPYGRMHELYSIADIFVLPSIPSRRWAEQFGIVLIEAMASGLPIVTTSGSSIPDVVGDAALIIPPADWLALYDGIKQLARSESMRKELSSKALKRAKTEFDSVKIAAKIEDVYRKLSSD